MSQFDGAVAGVEVLSYRCHAPGCGMTEERRRPPAGAGTADDSARAAGWHVGYRDAPQGRGRARVEYCPACMGHDPGYWARREPESTGVHALPPGWGAAE